jgi:predicted cupin superfamily sugar epimerase
VTDPRPHLAQALDLQPHPEGGWYRQTWRSSTNVMLPGYDGERATATAIYFLLHPGERSEWHVVRSEELWFWHMGGPLTLRLGGTDPAGPAEAPTDLTLGADAEHGEQPQLLVQAGVWQSAEPAGDEPVLVSCVVSPGFDFADFRLFAPDR